MNYFKVLIIFLVISSALAQKVVIKGTVRHANNYREIDGANIYIENSVYGTISSADGTFSLQIDSVYLKNTLLIVEHVAYDTLKIQITEAVNQKALYLWPRIIQLPQISVFADRGLPEINRDLPQPVTIMADKTFDTRGYLDAGDLLRTEQSIQVEEQTSGKKTIALRAGNPDDVIVLYNGVRMNQIYDNFYDLSLINLDDVRRIEIIKGSNSSLYGPDAFSGIINIVPKMHRGYNIRFLQRIGTYASGDWNLQLNYSPSNRFNLSYTMKNGASKKYYIATESDDDYITNSTNNHTASAAIDFSGSDSKPRSLEFLFYKINTDYENKRYSENISTLNDLLSLRYSGNIFFIHKLNIISAYQTYNNSQNILYEDQSIIRKFDNQSYNFHIDKQLTISRFELILGYEFEQGKLNYFNDRRISYEEQVGLISGNFTRQENGFVIISKLHLPTESKYIKTTDIDFSLRYDKVQNSGRNLQFKTYNPELLDEATRYYKNNDWDKATFKFSSHFAGQRNNININAYMNYGSNVKFPSLFQQLSLPVPSEFSYLSFPSRLAPEENSSLEIGIDLIRDNMHLHTWDGWQFHFNIFRNYFDNKFRTFYSPGIPVAFYDNVPNAYIFGVEYRLKIFMARSKVTMEFGGSNYHVSDKAAFPFKSDNKIILNIHFEHAGFLAHLHAFREGEQIGWVQSYQDVPWQVFLPAYANLDFHLGKNIYWGKLKLFANFSGRNLFDTKTSLAGIALRDTRYYISFGIQY